MLEAFTALAFSSAALVQEPACVFATLFRLRSPPHSPITATHARSAPTVRDLRRLPSSAFRPVNVSDRAGRFRSNPEQPERTVWSRGRLTSMWPALLHARKFKAPLLQLSVEGATLARVGKRNRNEIGVSGGAISGFWSSQSLPPLTRRQHTYNPFRPPSRNALLIIHCQSFHPLHRAGL